MAKPVTVNDVLDGHVALDLECLDRIYLNAYVPNLQVGGQVVSFLTAHLGYPIPSPAIFDKIGTAFRRAVAGSPMTSTSRWCGSPRPTARSIGCVPTWPRRPGRAGPGWPRSGSPRSTRACSPAPNARVDRGAVVLLRQGRPAGDAATTSTSGTKTSGRRSSRSAAYFPYPAKIWINGHEWAKRQAVHAGIGFTELSNGFAATDDPAGLQAICDRLGPDTDHRVRRALVLGPAGATDRRRRGRRVLVGTVDAPDRGLAHHRVHRAPPRPRVLRGPGRRQPRHRPPRPGRADLLPASGTARAPAHGAEAVQDQGRHPRRRCHRERLLQALPHQAVPERRSGAAHRDRHQRRLRPGLSAPPAQPARTADQSPCRQPPPARY